jgi:hypothetical protein
MTITGIMTGTLNAMAITVITNTNTIGATIAEKT